MCSHWRASFTYVHSASFEKPWVSFRRKLSSRRLDARPGIRQCGNAFCHGTQVLTEVDKCSKNKLHVLPDLGNLCGVHTRSSLPLANCSDSTNEPKGEIFSPARKGSDEDPAKVPQRQKKFSQTRPLLSLLRLHRLRLNPPPSLLPPRRSRGHRQRPANVASVLALSSF
jgi:hypothetical protein